MKRAAVVICVGLLIFFWMIYEPWYYSQFLTPFINTRLKLETSTLIVLENNILQSTTLNTETTNVTS